MSGSNIHLRSIVGRENSPASSVRQTQQGFTVSIDHLELCDSRMKTSLGGIKKRKYIHNLLKLEKLAEDCGTMNGSFFPAS
jgi:hypothetical protein